MPLFASGTLSTVRSASQKKVFCGADTITLSVESCVPLDFRIGDQITAFSGETYTLNALPPVKKTGPRRFSYNLTFEGRQYELVDTQWLLPEKTALDSLTGTLDTFVDLLITNANRTSPGRWKKGVTPKSDTVKTLSYVGRNCLDVMWDLCTQFNTEVDITENLGTLTINFRSVGSVFPFLFEYGSQGGLYSIERKSVSGANIITRLYCYGANKNIPTDYRYNRLCLPDKSRNASYIEDAAAVERYGLREARKEFNDIFPQRYGKVTGFVQDEPLGFDDGTMDFDLCEKDLEGNTLWMLDGTAPKIEFTTGQLAGYSFEIVSYNHAKKRFRIKSFTDASGFVFPDPNSAARYFDIGDTYFLTEIKVPQSYIKEAEAKLQEEGLEAYDTNKAPQASYSIEIEKSFLEKFAEDGTEAALFLPGDYLKIEDADLGVQRNIRIKELTRDLLDPYSYKLTLSDAEARATTITRAVTEVQEIKEIIQANDLTNIAKARRNWRATQDVLSAVFDPDGNYYTEKIKPLSIETTMLAVGAKSQQFTLAGVNFEPNYNGDANSIASSAGILAHFAIEETVRSWNIAAVSISALQAESIYYVYAKCQRTGDAGIIVTDTKQRKVDEEANYYYFLVGTLSSVIADEDGSHGARVLALTYGSSTVNGRFIKTGRIQSADGKTYFDLDAGAIGGRILFLDGKTIEELGYDNTKTAIDGGLVTSGTLQVAGEDGQVLAGMTGKGTGSAAVRYWAGKTFAERESAPFRVLQDGTAHLEKLVAYGARIENKVANKFQRIEIVGNAVKGTTKGETDLLITNDDNPGLFKLSETPGMEATIIQPEGFDPPLTDDYRNADLEHDAHFEEAIFSYYNAEIFNYSMGYIPATSKINFTTLPDIDWCPPFWLSLEDGLGEYGLNNAKKCITTMEGPKMWLYKDGVPFLCIGTGSGFLSGSSQLCNNFNIGEANKISFTRIANSVTLEEGGVFSLRVIVDHLHVHLDAQDYYYSNQACNTFVNGWSYPVDENGDGLYNPWMMIKLINGLRISIVLPPDYKGLTGFASFRNGFVYRNTNGFVRFSESEFYVNIEGVCLKIESGGIKKSTNGGATWTNL